MKNLKKLDRKELKTINGRGLFDNVSGVIEKIEPVILPITTTLDTTTCNIQCVVNGIVQIKVVECGSTC